MTGPEKKEMEVVELWPLQRRASEILAGWIQQVAGTRKRQDWTEGIETEL